MITVNLESDLDRLVKQFSGVFSKRRLDSVIASALTATASEAQKEIKAQMPKVFDRPTPFTMRSTFVRRADAKNLVAYVGLRDGNNRATYGISVNPETFKPFISSQVYGGDREQKVFEKKLTQMGYLPQGWVALPTSNLKTDAYGNVNASRFKQIISGLVGKHGLPTSPNAMDNAAKFFVIKQGSASHLKSGIWFRSGKDIRILFAFQPAASYKERLPIGDIVSETYAQRFAQLLDYYAQRSAERLVDSIKVDI